VGETLGIIAILAVVVWLVFFWNPRWPTFEAIQMREEEERRTRPDLWCVPSMVGGTASFGQALNLHVSTNGFYDRDEHVWKAQDKPALNDLVITLTMDSGQGVIVRKDERGRVCAVEYSEGWKQPYVEVAYDVEGVTQPITQRYPLSETCKTGMDRVWVVSR
jgi:hypothetical protein